MLHKDLENRKKKVIEFIKKNPKATYKDIRKNLHLHPERIFKYGMKEIFDIAKIKEPRTFKRKTKEERKKLIIEFIKKNPNVGGNIISKRLKINVSSAFKSIKEAYESAGVEYPRIRSYNKTTNEKRYEILKFVKGNPNITLKELIEKTNVKNPYRLFENFEDIYNKAGIKNIKGREKIRLRKRKIIINYIKNNPLSTQREINKNCNTKVQKIFQKGIIEAYEKAGISYPFERRKIHGTALSNIKNRAKFFEDEIAIRLSGYGTINKLVRTKRGVADIVLERKNKKIPIEIKDYQNKEISISQIKQLNKYIEDINSNIGILICHKKPKKDRFLIGKNRIFVLERQELKIIPDII